MKPTNVKRIHWWKYNFLFFAEHFLGSKKYQTIFGKTEQKLLKKVSTNVKARKTNFEVIEYHKGNYPEPLYDYHNPKVFRGAAEDWGTKQWDMDYFSEHFGKERVTLINNEGLVGNSDQDNDEISLKEYIEGLKKGSNKYLKFSRLVHDQSFLKKDIDLNWLSKFKSTFSFGELFYFFIGGQGTITPIHNGMSRTIFVQVEGVKKWTFYATEERIFLNVRPKRYNYYFSDANPDVKDDPNFPLQKHAKKWEVTIHPGDVLFIPPHVWHQVENITDSIGFAYKFAHLPSSFKSSKMLSLLYFFSTKPSFLNSTAHLWKKKQATDANYN